MKNLTADRTTYSREYARRAREKQWLVAAENATVCPARLARGHVCQTPLQSRFVQGKTVPFCPTCDRKRRGICIDCHREPVYGKVGCALRCSACSRLARQEQTNRHGVKKRATKREKARQYARDHREDRIEYKRLYRKIKPQRAAQLKRESYRRNREKALAYHAAYRASRLEQKRETERLRALGQLPPRTCLTCDTVLTGRPKRCTPCKEADRRQAREEIMARLERAAA